MVAVGKLGFQAAEAEWKGRLVGDGWVGEADVVTVFEFDGDAAAGAGEFEALVLFAEGWGDVEEEFGGDELFVGDFLGGRVVDEPCLGGEGDLLEIAADGFVRGGGVVVRGFFGCVFCGRAAAGAAECLGDIGVGTEGGGGDAEGDSGGLDERVFVIFHGVREEQHAFGDMGVGACDALVRGGGEFGGDFGECFGEASAWAAVGVGGGLHDFGAEAGHDFEEFGAGVGHAIGFSGEAGGGLLEVRAVLEVIGASDGGAGVVDVGCQDDLLGFDVVVEGWAEVVEFAGEGVDGFDDVEAVAFFDRDGVGFTGEDEEGFHDEVEPLDGDHGIDGRDGDWGSGDIEFAVLFEGGGGHDLEVELFDDLAGGHVERGDGEVEEPLELGEHVFVAACGEDGFHGFAEGGEGEFALIGDVGVFGGEGGDFDWGGFVAEEFEEPFTAAWHDEEGAVVEEVRAEGAGGEAEAFEAGEAEGVDERGGLEVIGDLGGDAVFAGGFEELVADGGEFGEIAIEVHVGEEETADFEVLGGGGEGSWAGAFGDWGLGAGRGMGKEEDAGGGEDRAAESGREFQDHGGDYTPARMSCQ